MRILISLIWLLGHGAISCAEVVVSIDINNPGPQISKDIYGQFVEHLGRGIYEGIWVGTDSKIPNTDGYRNDVLQALKELQVPVMRWPGGCFADTYHWRDGIGPREQRPRRINSLWGGVIEDNSFGTHEFLNLAERIGSDVYINANLGSGSPREMAEWLEYMTADTDSELARLRRANGRDRPWHIKYLAIGNESWGCGGNMTPEYYAGLYRQYATFARTPADNQPIMIASGGHDDGTGWTETLSQIEPNWSLRLDAISHHYYTLPTGNWDNKGSATGFSAAQWFSTLSNTLKLEDYIRANLAIMDQYDPEGRLGFFIDEWGAWYDTEEGDVPGFLYQQNTLRDAVLAAVNLNLFQRYAGRIRMTSIAQMINVLQSMILTDGEKMLLTPTYHVYRMYIPFQGARALPLRVRNRPGYEFGGQSIPGISASAARGSDGKVYVSLVNLDPESATAVTVDTGGTYRSAHGRILTAAAMDAHNTFSSPDRVRPEAYDAGLQDGALVLPLPAKSVVVVALE